MRRKRLIAILGMAAVLVVSAGCSGILGPGTSVSQVDAGVTEENVPYIAYNYTVQDYADALLEGPNGQIVAEEQLSPESGRSAFRLADPRSGTYTIAIQEGGETKVTEEVEFDGPNPEIVSLNGIWSGSTLEQIQVDIRNTGDMPVQISEVSIEARGQEMRDSSKYTWLDQNDSAQFSAAGSYSDTITIEEAGTVTGDVSIETSAGTLQGSINEEFEAPSVEFVSITPNWEGNELTNLAAEVRNTGDLPTEVNVTVGNPDPVYYTGEKRVEPHSVEEFDFDSETIWESALFWAESGGNHSLEVVADSPDGFASQVIYHEVEGGTVEIESMTPDWQNGQLESISYSVANDGETEAETEIVASVNGEEVGSDSIALDPETSESFEISGFTSLYSAESGGDFTVELAAEEYDSSARDTVSFDGPEADISNIEASFGTVWDSEKVELSSVDFELRNGGDVKLSYSDFRVTLDGATRTTSPYTTELRSGETTSHSEYYSDGIAVAPGQYDLTVEILDSGEVISSRTVSVTAE
jgi:hypothetical protein